jgi:hypothetical protein
MPLYRLDVGCYWNLCCILAIIMQQYCYICVTHDKVIIRFRMWPKWERSIYHSISQYNWDPSCNCYTGFPWLEASGTFWYFWNSSKLLFLQLSTTTHAILQYENNMQTLQLLLNVLGELHAPKRRHVTIWKLLMCTSEPTWNICRVIINK